MAKATGPAPSAPPHSPQSVRPDGWPGSENAPVIDVIVQSKPKYLTTFATFSRSLISVFSIASSLG